MCSDSKLSRLCRLVDDSLRPYTEADVVSVAKEREILVTLSQVLRQVEDLTQALDSGSDNEDAVELHFESDCMCLTKIIIHLVVLLTVESKYIKHLACNVLVSVSEFVAVSGSSWDAFIHLLCICMDLAISCSSSDLTTGAANAQSASSSLVFVLKPRLENADWVVAVCVLRVLRDIRKYLKSEVDDELLKVYFDSINYVLSTMRWDLFHEMHVGPNADAEKSSHGDVLLRKSLFLGTLVQFFCSLAEQSESTDNHHPIISTIVNLVPKLLCCCLGQQADCVNFNKCISQYFRHKLLVLMIRLISQSCQESLILVSWLQLIHNYFGELLRKPISPLGYNQDDCLEGSPFLSSVDDADINSLSSRHLQRQAVFLFLSCSFHLISSNGCPNKKCACATWNLHLTCDSNAEAQCCARKKGLLELYRWLQWHLPDDILLDHDTYFKKCVDFAKSFLQLYIKEDDVLFKVLLQLLAVPFYAEQFRFEDGRGAFQDSKGNVLFRISDLFNPVLLFHLFLLELSYDHQVLLDYLISKDTGIICAEYLLRCLRKVCDPWSSFSEFSVGGQGTAESSCKKRKIPLANSSFQEKDFNDAKCCLLSLKNSIEKLHRRNLFPYNPSVLLNRLTRFQELCFKEEE